MAEQDVVAMTEPRELEAKMITIKYANWSLVPGILPTPLLDMALLAGIQLRMVQQLSKLYGVPFNANAGKSIISALIGSIVPTKAGFGFTGSAIKSIPVVGGVLGFLFMPAFAWAATYAVGTVFIQHFASGGTFLTFKPAEVREFFREEFEKRYAERAQMGGPGKPGGGESSTVVVP